MMHDQQKIIIKSSILRGGCAHIHDIIMIYKNQGHVHMLSLHVIDDRHVDYVDLLDACTFMRWMLVNDVFGLRSRPINIGGKKHVQF